MRAINRERDVQVSLEHMRDMQNTREFTFSCFYKYN